MPPTTSFQDLPIEVLPLILERLVGRRSDLRHATLVCRQWRAPAERLQYSWIRLWGRDLAIVSLVFRTLADNPHLCHMIRKFEVRVFSLSLILSERLEMEQLAVRVLRQAIRLEHLIWTRKGALTDRVFEAITSISTLRSFELNAHTNLSPGSWDADHLLRLPKLRTLSLILPDRSIAHILPAFLQTQRTLSKKADPESEGWLELQELSILCRESPNINDSVVSACSPFLQGSALKSLVLAGCSRLTGATLLPLLATLPFLEHLALEATSIPPSFYIEAAPLLTHLRSLKLTHPGPKHPTSTQFSPSLCHLLQYLPDLRSFTLYHSGTSASGGWIWPIVEPSLMDAIVKKKRLEKFECSGVLMEVEEVERLCMVQGLKDMVIHLGWEIRLPRVTNAISHLPRLKTLHILAQTPEITMEKIEAIVASSPSLEQIGFRNRVWHVRRKQIKAASNETKTSGEEPTTDDYRIKVSLERWDSPWWPEALFVISLREGTEAFGAFRRSRYGAEDDNEQEMLDDESSSESDEQ
ncbi:BQ5605_C003g02443 [Microbotryum silenes-dioicae]|uniref:BQ5605_C003g02443 protein n=1 Tax=Microbotryum silenes-dioicae TaxID=796604 RepID=A0A2X0M5P9_9BASI|nr:BQ5605_C003g02443 [Microbotryum silenes-dioicae]